jgi:DNA invertase Pin-like site-specific DNA recombinase
MTHLPEEITNQFNNLNFKWADLKHSRVIGICRISSGTIYQGLSIPQQTQMLQKFNNNHIKSNNFNIFSYQRSGRDINKQKEIIDAIEENTNTVFAFPSIDRFTRDRNYGYILDKCKENNNILVFVKEELRSDYEEDERKIHYGIFESFKEGEKITLRNRNNAKFRKEHPELCKPREKKPPCGFTYVTTVIGGIAKKIIVSNENEIKLSKVVKTLKYGGNATSVNKILIEMTGNKKHALYDVNTNQLLSEISKGMMSQQQIVNFFATFNEEDVPITYRGKPITKSTISKLLKI